MSRASTVVQDWSGGKLADAPPVCTVRLTSTASAYRRQRLRRAGDRAKTAVMASDAYFPFPDGIQAAATAGVTAIIQPGGSIRDEMAIEVADRHHLAMVFTGRRHFRH